MGNSKLVFKKLSDAIKGVILGVGSLKKKFR